MCSMFSTFRHRILAFVEFAPESFVPSTLGPSAKNFLRTRKTGRCCLSLIVFWNMILQSLLIPIHLPPLFPTWMVPSGLTRELLREFRNSSGLTETNKFMVQALPLDAGANVAGVLVGHAIRSS